MGRGDFAFENDYFGDTKMESKDTPEQRDLDEEISFIEGLAAGLLLAKTDERDEEERNNIEHDRLVFLRAVERLKKIRKAL
jgi:hypothetical protein